MTTPAELPETPMAAAIVRNPDGRHAVMDQHGKLVGLHNSHLSALRQLTDYFGSPHVGTPPEIGNAASAPARAYSDAARRLKGETVTMNVPTDRKSFLGTLFLRRAA